MKKHESQFDPATEWLWERGVRFHAFLRASRVGAGAARLDSQQRARFDRTYRRYLSVTGLVANDSVVTAPR
jgi:hypothetical protein